MQIKWVLRQIRTMHLFQGLFWRMKFLYVGRISVKSLNNFLDISLGLEVSQDQPFNLTGPQPPPLWNGNDHDGLARLW